MIKDTLYDAGGFLYVMAGYAYYILKSMRPNQWYKNLLLFAGLAFSGSLLNLSLWETTFLAFGCFCLASSAGYIINDIVDKKKDSEHPYKYKRPIALGKISVKYAVVIASVLLAVALAGSWLVGFGFFLVLIGYLAVTMSYSYFLKKIVLVDIIAVSSGFVLRAVGGCVAINVEISSWLIICSFLLALFLVLNKRWHSMSIDGAEGYSPETLQKLTSIVTSSLLVSYLVYVITTKKEVMLVSAVFVVYGLFRYMYLVQHMNKRADPDKVLRDKGMLISIGCWVTCVLMLSKL